MITVFLVIHVLLAVTLIGVVLLQRSEGGGLGIGGSGGGMGSFMGSRATASLLTRTTAILAAAFMANSLLLALLTDTRTADRSIVDDVGRIEQEAPLSVPLPETDPAPAPSPSVPLGE